MKNFTKILIPVIVSFFVTSFALGAPVSNVFTNIIPAANQTYDNGTTTPAREWKNIYTKNLTVSGTCIGCGSSGTFSFTPTTNFGNLANSTSTQMWFRGTPYALSASSTSIFDYASTTAFTNTGNAYLGTVASGLWNGTTIGVGYGGTGQTSFTSGNLLYGNGTGALQNVGTTTLTASSPLSLSQPISVIGSAGSVLSLSTAGDWTGTFDGQEGTYYLNRANHTGTQGISTLSNYDWTFGSTYNANNLTASTSIPVWVKGQLNASSTAFINGLLTAPYASTTYITSSQGATFATASGNVGIGTTSPTNKLVVESNGTTRFVISDSGNTGFPGFYSQEGSIPLAYFNGWDSANNQAQMFTDAYAYPINMMNGQLYLKNGGNVGMGTTSPYTRLSVVGETVAAYFTATTTTASTFPYASTTAETVSGSLYVTPLTSALILTGADGLMAEYAGTTCTNQFARALSALGVATCATVDLTADVTGTLPIAKGGTNASSFTTTNNGVAWNGTSLITAPLTSAITYPYASTTSISSSNSAYFATSGGNVGIGTTTPTQQLSIGNAGLLINRDTDPAFILFQGNGSGRGQIRASASDRLSITNPTGVSEYLTVNTSSGNVGIGTTTPQGLLTVSGDLTTKYGLILDANTYTKREWGFYTLNSTNDFVIRDITSGADRLNITSTGLFTVGNASTTQIGSTGSAYLATSGGNVGIGTTGPNTQLEVVSSAVRSTSANSTMILRDSRTQAADVGGSLYFKGYKIGTTNESIFGGIIGGKENGTSGNESGYLSFHTDPNTGVLVERMRLDSVGKLGVGTLTPQNQFNVSNAGAAGLEINPTLRDGTTAGAFLLSYNRSGAAYVPLQLDASYVATMISGTEKMRVDTTGNVGIGDTTPDALLDLESTATTSVRIDSSHASRGSCLVMKDRDGSGYTYITVNNGVLTADTISCE